MKKIIFALLVSLAAVAAPMLASADCCSGGTCCKDGVCCTRK